MMPRLFLFDCDGTILDSFGIIHDSISQTFTEFGHRPPEPAETRSIIGLTLVYSLARLRKTEVTDEISNMALRYKEIFHEKYRSPGFSQSLYPGMGALVETLAVKPDTKLGLITGKSRRGLDLFFTMHGYRSCFGPIRTADDCPSKPDPAMVSESCAEAGIDPVRTVVIGDSIYDMQMAKSAGARAIGVAWGYHEVSDLKAAGADDIALDSGHLIRLLEENHA